MPKTERRFVLAACGFAIQFSCAFSFAQPTTAPSGLDSLTDDRLMADLANRGLSSLLDRSLEINQVPPARRDALRSILLLRQLNDPRAGLSAAQRQAMAQQIAAGVEVALPTLNDPQVLMQQATALLSAGVERDANTLEYWGDNAKTQAALHPVVDAVIKLFDKAAAQAKQQADVIANNITGPDDPRGKHWEQLSSLATSAAYTRHMVDYYDCLSLDKSDPQRKDIAAKAIDFLHQYDTADSTVQPAVRLRIAKLHMMREEFDQAQEIFATVSATPTKDISPAPDPSQQWEARYFSAVCDLSVGTIPAAQKSLDALIAWQKQNLPQDSATQAGAAAATSMLQYRIDVLLAQTGGTDDIKAKANSDSIAVLIDLVKRRPDLQAVIFQQLMSKLPADADLKTIDPLLLQGYITAADQERQKPDDAVADPKILQRGIDAADQMLRRRESVDPQLVDTAILLRALFLERLGQHVEAATALLDYIKLGQGSPQNQQIALDNAMAIIAKLRAAPATADAPDTTKLYERFLPLAINPPFGRAEFAYEYARRLQLDGKFADAVDYFRKVPADDKRYAQARFYQMVALGQRLDEEKLSPDERKPIVGEVSDMVDDVSTRISAGINSAKDDNERNMYRSMLVRTLLLAGDIARREQNDPKRTITLLQNFESLAAGLPGEKDLLGNALYTRVQAYMSLGDSNAATQTLVTLLKTRPGGEGATIVYKLLQKLNDELEHARQSGDLIRTRQLAQNRAQLSGFLVDWARNNPDPNIKKFTYRYSVFDAATKQLAADLEPDPAAQKSQWQAALKLYHDLESPQNAELYKATLDPKSADMNYPDPAVSLGIGSIAYDLGNYAEAQQRLGKLLTDRKLGTPTTATEDAGQTKLLENDQYWEATLDLMRSNVALASANPNDAQAQAAKTETTNYLKQLYVRYGRDVGGKKWAPQFETLRKEIAPDLNPDDFTVQTH